MKLLLVLHQFFPRHQTGTETYTYGVAQELKKRHDVRLYYREHGRDVKTEERIYEEDVTIDGLQAHRVYLSRKGIWNNPFTRFHDLYDCRLVEKNFAAYLDKVKPDLVHIQHLAFLSGDIIRIVHERGIPVLLTLHDYWFICANAQLVRPNQEICKGHHMCWECVTCVATSVNMPRMRYLTPVLLPFFLRRASFLRKRLLEVDQLITPSQFLKSRFAQAGIPADCIHVLENGIDITGLSSRSLSQPTQSPLRVGFIGSIAWQKGVHVLIEAFNQVTAPATLEIFGDDALFPGYARTVREQARHPKIHFRGRFDHTRIWSVLSELDVLVVPSLWFENSPMVIREAFAAKVPVIASNLGALAEKVRDGIDGILYKPGDARALAALLQGIAEHPEQLDALRTNILPVKSVEQHVHELEDIYRGLLQQTGKSYDTGNPSRSC